MTVAERIRAMIEANPPDGSVLIPVARLKVWLEEDRGPAAAAAAPLDDLTVEGAAAEIGRAPSTVRTWCGRGLIAGAYKLNGREWRIPRDRFRSFLDSQSDGEGKEDASGGRLGEGLDGWREHYQASESA